MPSGARGPPRTECASEHQTESEVVFPHHKQCCLQTTCKHGISSHRHVPLLLPSRLAAQLARTEEAAKRILTRTDPSARGGTAQRLLDAERELAGARAELAEMGSQLARQVGWGTASCWPNATGPCACNWTAIRHSPQHKH